jgi:hypothetical protein
MSPLLTTTLLRPVTRARSSRDPIGQAGRKRNRVTHPMGADPASIVIGGGRTLRAVVARCPHLGADCGNRSWRCPKLLVSARTEAR